MGVTERSRLPGLGHPGHPRASPGEFFVLEDDQVAELRPGSVRVTTLDGAEVEPARLTVDWDLDAARKDGYDDFMSKEIHEQPKAVADTLLDRLLPDGTLVLDEVHITNEEFRAVNKVFIVACGSSYHAGLMAKYAIEHWARLPVEIDIASEFRYRDPVLDARTLVIGVSQSGETVDTFAGHRGGPPARGQGAGHLQRGRLVHGPRGRRRPLHPGRARRSGWPPPRPTWPRSPPSRSWPSTWPRPGARCSPSRCPGPVRRHGRPPRQGGPGPRAGRRGRGGGPPLPGLAVVHLPRPPRRLPGGPRGGAQAQGALLPAGRGVPGRASSSTAPSPWSSRGRWSSAWPPARRCGRR